MDRLANFPAKSVVLASIANLKVAVRSHMSRTVQNRSNNVVRQSSTRSGLPPVAESAKSAARGPGNNSALGHAISVFCAERAKL